MSYNDKNKMNIENDDLNIQSHLNASLDFEGISVSEDLIHRTLEAINKQTAEQKTGNVNNISTNNKTKKVIPWNRYIRGLAGVAAAALIIVAGYGLVNSGLSGKKADDSTDSSMAKDEVNYKMSAESSPEESSTQYATADSSAADSSVSNNADNAGTAAPQTADSRVMAEDADMAAGAASADSNTDADIAADKSESDNQLSMQYSIAADVGAASEEDGGTSGSEENSLDGSSLQQSLQATNGSTESSTLLTFREIFLPDPEQAENITITEVTSGNSITLTTKDEIDDFYSVMDQHQFTGSTKAGTDTDYVIKLKSLNTDESVYSMTVGTEIIVDYQNNEIASHSSYTSADDALLQDLQSLYNKYNK